MQTNIGPRRSCKRYNEPGHAHFLTFSCFQHHPILLLDHRPEWLAEALNHSRQQCQFDLWAYVFMPEHVHLLLWPRVPDYSISRFLQAVKMPVSRRILRQLRVKEDPRLEELATGQKERPHRFWQDRGGYDRNIVQAETIHRAIEYIHGNPVRRKLVNSPEEWKWSSAAEWMNEGAGPIRIDRDSVPPRP